MNDVEDFKGVVGAFSLSIDDLVEILYPFVSYRRLS